MALVWPSLALARARPDGKIRATMGVLTRLWQSFFTSQRSDVPATGTVAPARLMDQSDALHMDPSNMALWSGGLAIGTGSKAKVKIVNDVTYVTSGVD